MLVLLLYLFPVWLRNAGLEPVLSQTEKSCIALNYRQFSTKNKIKKKYKINPSFVSPSLRPRDNKTGFFLMI